MKRTEREPVGNWKLGRPRTLYCTTSHTFSKPTPHTVDAVLSERDPGQHVHQAPHHGRVLLRNSPLQRSRESCLANFHKPLHMMASEIAQELVGAAHATEEVLDGDVTEDLVDDLGREELQLRRRAWRGSAGGGGNMVPSGIHDVTRSWVKSEQIALSYSPVRAATATLGAVLPDVPIKSATGGRKLLRKLLRIGFNN